ncbi:MAG: PaaI family thioesterase [Candidatus Bipolaricaulota bacterium]
MSQFCWTKEDNHCFGCGDNPWGLKLDFKENDGWVQARTQLDEKYQGFKSVAHGGIVATMLDEAGAWAAMLQTEYVAPSFEICCQFRKPVPLVTSLLVRGKVLETRHGVVTSRAELLSEEGDLLAEAEVKSKMLNKLDG